MPQVAASPIRCLAVWAVVTAAAGLLVDLLAPDLDALVRLVASGPDGATTFEDVLSLGSAAALAGCAAWFWLVTTLVALEAARGTVGPGSLACPAELRRLLLAACGAALASSISAPALAVEVDVRIDPEVVTGLPVPDRPTAHQRSLPPVPPKDRPTDRPADRPAVRPEAAPRVQGGGVGASSVRVAPGDSLWAIARTTLPADAGNARIDAAWRSIYDHNTRALGPDPDLIHPGTRLELPPTSREDS